MAGVGYVNSLGLVVWFGVSENRFYFELTAREYKFTGISFYIHI